MCVRKYDSKKTEQRPVPVLLGDKELLGLLLLSRLDLRRVCPVVLLLGGDIVKEEKLTA